MPKSLYFFITLLFFMCMDFLWLGFFMKSTYQKLLGTMLRTSNSFTLLHGSATVAVWILIVTGIYFFVIPLVSFKTYTHTFAHGAFFGMVLYGVYELTNFVVLKKWPLSLIAIDIVWGMFACGATAVLLKKLTS